MWLKSSQHWLTAKKFKSVLDKNLSWSQTPQVSRAWCTHSNKPWITQIAFREPDIWTPESRKFVSKSGTPYHRALCPLSNHTTGTRRPPLKTPSVIIWNVYEYADWCLFYDSFFPPRIYFWNPFVMEMQSIVPKTRQPRDYQHLVFEALKMGGKMWEPSQTAKVNRAQRALCNEP